MYLLQRRRENEEMKPGINWEWAPNSRPQLLLWLGTHRGPALILGIRIRPKWWFWKDWFRRSRMTHSLMLGPVVLKAAWFTEDRYPVVQRP